ALIPEVIMVTAIDMAVGMKGALNTREGLVIKVPIVFGPVGCPVAFSDAIIKALILSIYFTFSFFLFFI
ncbi:hypothetical protein NG876_14260, partial [Enterococcus faecium]|uniref:hypothetical protein n=1 Tax=Enterococcus faecium TaxID=1352 RepID=UPI0020900362